jgi:hypothetical protein
MRHSLSTRDAGKFLVGGWGEWVYNRPKLNGDESHGICKEIDGIGLRAISRDFSTLFVKRHSGNGAKWEITSFR